MAGSENAVVSVEILGQTLQFTCPTGEEQNFIAAVNALNAAVDDAKKQSVRGRSNEKLLLMAALSLSHQLIQANQTLRSGTVQIDQMIDKITSSFN